MNRRRRVFAVRSFNAREGRVSSLRILVTQIAIFLYRGVGHFSWRDEIFSRDGVRWLVFPWINSRCRAWLCWILMCDGKILSTVVAIAIEHRYRNVSNIVCILQSQYPREYAAIDGAIILIYMIYVILYIFVLIGHDYKIAFEYQGCIIHAQYNIIVLIISWLEDLVAIISQPDTSLHQNIHLMIINSNGFIVRLDDSDARK